MQEPKLIWDCGTAYDMFISLHMLHEPARYRLRGAWAKGVRSRLPASAREVLSKPLFGASMGWVHSLPKPKDGATVLQTLAQIPADERMTAVMLDPSMPCDLKEVLEGVAARGAWDEEACESVRAAYESAGWPPPKREKLIELLELWSRPQEFGERLLEALQAYQEVFFAEEEARILPHLKASLAQAQALAEKLPLSDLLEELSQGLRLDEAPELPELVLAPSFWSTPLLIFSQISAERELILYGARPHNVSLVPGDVVPDTLLGALKALGDPTRLRILRYLVAEPLTPTQLARRLRLRAPTVVHHLDILRLARLVHLTLKSGEKWRYSVRPEAVRMTFDALEEFLEAEGFDNADEA